MIARVLNTRVTGDGIECEVQYLEGPSPEELTEVGTKTFAFSSDLINAQVRSAIIAYGKTLTGRRSEVNRLQQLLPPGTEFPI